MLGQTATCPGLEHAPDGLSVAEIIAFVSEAITLEPGDVILTARPTASVFSGTRSSS